MHLDKMQSGLTTAQAKELLSKYGPNELVKPEENKDLKILLRQITQNPIIYILCAAAVISYFSEEFINTYIILFVIAYVIILGFYQERKADKAMAALKAMIKPETRVLRDGKVTTVEVREIVPGDVLVLEMGDNIGADARVFNSLGLRVDEAALTGESVPVNKSDGDMIYAGTQVVYGKCYAVVERTGMATRLGEIAKLIEAHEEETPLQAKINVLVRKFALFTLALMALMFIIGLLTPGTSISHLLVLTLALAVASVPEGLPLVLTTTLALGMNWLAKRNAIVRRLSAVETLGSVTVICTDKTGTMTKNEMVVEKVFFDGKLYDVSGSGYEPVGKIMLNGKKVTNSALNPLKPMMRAAVLCNNSNIEKKDGKWRVVGDPTEGALISLAAKCGIFKAELDKKYPKIKENFFTSERKMMSTMHKVDGKTVAYVKGAPEVLLSKSTHIVRNGKVRKITSTDMYEIRKTLDEFGKSSLRVLGLAYKEVKRAEHSCDIETNLIFYGLVGMADPLREGVVESVAACKEGGIRVMMITGDNPETARTVAIKAGIITPESRVVTGAELDKMSDDELVQVVREVNVYARTYPEHKLKIVEVLRADNNIVAMTGDGVNDAPALKKADIGVAMGIKGTDVSKEASDVVLTDDNFVTLVEAIRGGRSIFENVQKTTAFIVSRNYAMVFLLLIATVLVGVEYSPLLALQILFINLIDEEIPAVVLSLDPPRKGIMQAKPRNPKEGLLPPRLLVLMFSLAIFTAFIIYAVFAYYDPINNLDIARTTAFGAVVLTVIFNAASFKSLHEPLSIGDILSSKLLLLSLVFSLLAAGLIVYTPTLQGLFSTVALPLENLAVILFVGIATMVFMECGKFILKTGTQLN
ncbi:MAG: cation-translocating P-type ATPase [Candidatus Micrarchaeia archaeon]